MFDGLRGLIGVMRSLRIYYGNAQRRTGMDELYGQFVRAGDLVFDIGAHVVRFAASAPAWSRSSRSQHRCRRCVCSTAAIKPWRSSRWRSAPVPARSSFM
jgi:hypothetical protein